MSPQLPRHPLRAALLAAALACPAGFRARAMEEPLTPENIFLTFTQDPGGRFVWDAVQLGVVHVGPHPAPFQVPDQHFLLVDRVDVTLRASTTGWMGWSLPLENRAGEPLGGFHQELLAEAPRGVEGAFTFEDSRNYILGIHLPAGTRILAPCPLRMGSILSVRIAGRLVALPPALTPPATNRRVGVAGPGSAGAVPRRPSGSPGTPECPPGSEG